MSQVNYRNNIQLPKPEKKIVESSLNIPKDELLKARERVKEKLIFSFKFLDLEHKLFNLGCMEKRKTTMCGEWFLTLLQTLKDVSKLDRFELITQKQHYDAHGHKWEELRYHYGFDEEFYRQVECMQFRISKSEGRVHGFIIGNKFYIVWLDPHHNLYPDEKYGGTKWYSKPLNCFEKLELGNKELLEEIKKLKEEINTYEEVFNEYAKENK